MKLRPFKALLAILLVGSLALPLLAGDQSDQPVKSESADSPKATLAPKPATSGKKPKGKDTGDPTLPPRVKKAKEIPFPVPIHHDAEYLKVPSYDQVGKLLSVLMATKAYRLDNENVQMDGMNFDLSPGDDKNEYKVEMPTSVLNLKTNVISSDHAVVIRTKDFELTGERVKFDTVERTGELLGHVHMVIHNLKQVATPGQPSSDLQ